MSRVKINKKIIAVVVLAVLLIVGAVVAVLYIRKDTNGDTTTASRQMIKEKACGLVSLNEAKRIFGDDIKQENHSPTKSDPLATANAKKQTVPPSVCVYTNTKKPNQHPTMVTVLPVSNDELSAQLQSMTAGGKFNKMNEYGDNAFQETTADLTGKKYSRVVIGYNNAIVTISLDESEGNKIKPLVNVMQAKVQDE